MVVLAILAFVVGIAAAVGFIVMLLEGEYGLAALACVIAALTITGGVFAAISVDNDEKQQRAAEVVRTCAPFGGEAPGGRTVDDTRGKYTDSYYVYVCNEGPRVPHVQER